MQRFQTRLNNAITCVKYIDISLCNVIDKIRSRRRYDKCDTNNTSNVVFFGHLFLKSGATYVHWRNVNYSWLPYDRQCRQPLRKKLQSLHCFRFVYYRFLIEIIVWNNAGKRIFGILSISEKYASLKYSYKPLNKRRRSKIHMSLPFLSITLFVHYKSYHRDTTNRHVANQVLRGYIVFNNMCSSTIICDIYECLVIKGFSWFQMDFGASSYELLIVTLAIARWWTW